MSEPVGRNFGPWNSSELKRIIELPRRTLDLSAIPDLTPVFRRPGGFMSLWPIQSAALLEMEALGGGFFPVGAGHGKTIISLLAPAVWGCSAVLLVPANLKAKTLKERPELERHWDLPPIHVVAYTELSSSTKADVLDRLKPALIIADEGHALKHKGSARTKRFLRYMQEHQDTRFVVLSGTMTKNSIKDFAHLLALALRHRAPIPCLGNVYHELNAWAEALDVSPYPAPPGALVKLCEEHGHGRDHEGIRHRFRCRLVSSPGVVATDETAVSTSLVIRAVRPEVPDSVRDALLHLRETWEVGEEEISDALTFHRVARQLACGFYYKWDWPGGVKDYEWLEARAAWHRQVRDVLRHRSAPGLDSPLLVANAAASDPDRYPAWADWDRVRRRPAPPTVAVWVDEFLAQVGKNWAEEQSKRVGNGIIWFTHQALGERIAALGGLPLFGAGDDDKLLAATPVTHPVIVCSVAAHGEGKNLQKWSRNLFTTPLGGLKAEQTLARTHRPGQMADEVWVDVFVHTEELEQSWTNGMREAEYIQSTSGNKQRLIYASKVDF